VLGVDSVTVTAYLTRDERREASRFGPHTQYLRMLALLTVGQLVTAFASGTPPVGLLLMLVVFVLARSFHLLSIPRPLTWVLSAEGLLLREPTWEFMWPELGRWRETPDAFLLSAAQSLPRSLRWLANEWLGINQLRFMPVILPKRVMTPEEIERVRALLRPPQP
jgi:hypothetical protein